MALENKTTGVIITITLAGGWNHEMLVLIQIMSSLDILENLSTPEINTKQ